jgi:hypothetical protein
MEQGNGDVRRVEHQVWLIDEGGRKVAREEIPYMAFTESVHLAGLYIAQPAFSGMLMDECNISARHAGKTMEVENASLAGKWVERCQESILTSSCPETVDGSPFMVAPWPGGLIVGYPFTIGGYGALASRAYGPFRFVDEVVGPNLGRPALWRGGVEACCSPCAITAYRDVENTGRESGYHFPLARIDAYAVYL